MKVCPSHGWRGFPLPLREPCGTLNFVPGVTMADSLYGLPLASPMALSAT